MDSTGDKAKAHATQNGVELERGAKEELDRIDPDDVVAGCFEFRLRTRSFDLHQLSHGTNKLKKLGRMFRSPSDAGAKAASSVPCSSAANSPRHSPPRRRRLVRVVRDVNPEVYGEGNPHVVHRYSDAFLQKTTRQRTLSESDYPGDRPLPYEVTGHTILKKTSLNHSISIHSCNSADVAEGESTPPVFKHASFRDEVVVIEFDQKCKVGSPAAAATHVVRLRDAVFEDVDSYAACKSFEDMAINETIAALTDAVDCLKPAEVTNDSLAGVGVPEPKG